MHFEHGWKNIKKDIKARLALSDRILDFRYALYI